MPNTDTKEAVFQMLRFAWAYYLDKTNNRDPKKVKLIQYELAEALAFDKNAFTVWKNGKSGKDGNQIAHNLTKRLISLFSGDSSFARTEDFFVRKEAMELGEKLHELWELKHKKLKDQTIGSLTKYLEELYAAKRNLNTRTSNHVSASDLDPASVAFDIWPIAPPIVATASGNTKRRPRVRQIPTLKDELSVATLSVEIPSPKQFTASGESVASPLLAVIDLSPIDDEDGNGYIYFTAATVRVKAGDLAEATRSNVEIFFDDFSAGAGSGVLSCCSDEGTTVIIGEKRGVRDDPRWEINKIGNIVSKEGILLKGIELGSMSVRYLSDPPPAQVYCEFQAVVALADMVLIFEPEQNCLPNEAAKREAFDRVLANKKLKGNGRQAVVSTSILQIEPDDGLL
jgi:hypothetical protein